MAVTIAAVKPKSICFRHGVRAGEMLMQINGHEIVDILDYQFYATERRLTLTLRSTGGKYREIRIKKDEYEDLGLTFDTYLMDRQRHCANKCVFCFIDQLPKGMRESLYFIKVSVHSLLLKNKLDYPKGVSVSAFLNFIKGVRYVLDY